MNEPTNAPMFEAPPPPPEPFYQIWIEALTNPTEQTYAEIANSPDANPNKAYLWIFLVGLVSALFSAIISLFSNSGVFNGSDTAVGLIGMLCAIPIAAGLSALFFAIGVALVQWVASLFGGTGNYNKLVYPVAAFLAPMGLISGTLGLLIGLIPFVGLCFNLLIIMTNLYFEIVAVKAVNSFDWGKAIASVLIPFFVIIFVCGCLIIFILMLLGPVIGETFNTINQSLGY